MSSGPWYSYTTIFLPIHLLVNIWVASSFGLLWIMLLWTFNYLFCVDIRFLSSWANTQMRITGSHGKCVFNFIRYCILFSKLVVLFYISRYKISSCYTSLSTPRIFTLLNFNHAFGYVVVSHCVLAYIFLMTNNVEHIFMCLLAICRSSLWNVY